MKLENEFEVPVPIERAWPILLDIPRIAPCVPGATVEEAREDEFAGTMKVKLGPVVTTFKGTLRLEEADEAAHRAVLRAQARDARGQGSASATITSALETHDSATRVRVETEMRVTGRLAQFGRGVMQDVSAKLMDQFAQCLARELAGPEEAAAPRPPAPPEPPAAPEPVSPPAQEPTAEEPAAGATPPEPVSPHAQEPTAAGAATPEPSPPPAPRAAAPEAGPTPPGPVGEPPAAAAAPPRPAAEPLDLVKVGRTAVLRRAAPAAGALVAGLVLLRVLRRRR